MRKKHFRRLARRWHKRAGLMSAVVVLLLSITGILLNHTDALRLAKFKVSSPWLLSLYGQEVPEFRSYSLAPDGKVLLVSALSTHVYVEAKPLYQCSQTLVALSAFKGSLAVACRQSLALFDAQLNLVDVSDIYSGLPAPIESMGRCDQHFCIVSAAGQYALNSDTMQWQPSQANLSLTPVQATPAWVKKQVMASYGASELSWERVVLDLHAGRFLGSIGPFIMDLIALLFILAAVSGVYMWLGQNKKAAKKR
ncbi:PepSY domain-containing protein [Agaribacterium sp. ZY112]|uniref:PepSY domain-containing protein n=1 Tax=Agaribacterium sp. ZY112 TaxID=3233574 RepID=UPI003525C795